MVRAVLQVQSKMVDRTNSKNCNAMKKIFTKLMLLAVAAAALVSCENNLNDENPVLDLMQDVTLTAAVGAERSCCGYPHPCGAVCAG